jgi:hypothetical protein
MRPGIVASVICAGALGVAAWLGIGSALQADPPLDYDGWIANYPLAGADAARAADPDKDGLPNVLEFALAGCDPTANNSPASTASYPVLLWQTRGADGVYSAMTSARPTGTYDGTYILLRYQPRAGVTSHRIVPQVNTKTLAEWHWGPTAIREWSEGGYTYARTTSNCKYWPARWMRLTVEPID